MEVDIYSDELITSTEACEVLGISYRTLMRWIHDSRVLAYQRGNKGGRWLFRKKDINFLFKSNLEEDNV